MHGSRRVLDHVPAALPVRPVTARLGRRVLVTAAAAAVHFLQAQLLVGPQVLPDLQQPYVRIGPLHRRVVGGGRRRRGPVDGHGVIAAGAARQRGHHVRARGSPVRVVDPELLVAHPYGYPLGRHPLRKRHRLLSIRPTGRILIVVVVVDLYILHY